MSRNVYKIVRVYEVDSRCSYEVKNSYFNKHLADP